MEKNCPIWIDSDSKIVSLKQNSNYHTLLQTYSQDVVKHNPSRRNPHNLLHPLRAPRNSYCNNGSVTEAAMRVSLSPKHP